MKIELNTERMPGRGACQDGVFQVNYLHGLNDLCEKYIKSDFTVLELGSFDGVSTRLFSFFAKKVVAVDRARRKDMLNAIDTNKNICFYNTSFIDFLKQNTDKYDLIYIDGCHDYDSVKNDIQNFLPLVKEGGFISGHDYKNDVEKVVKEFFKEEKIELFSDSSWLVKL